MSMANPSGCFATRPVSAAAHGTLLEAADQTVTPAEAAAWDVTFGDGSFTAASCRLPYARCLGARRRAWTAFRMRSPCASGESWAASSPVSASCSADSPALPPSMLEGRITIPYSGKVADHALGFQLQPDGPI